MSAGRWVALDGVQGEHYPQMVDGAEAFLSQSNCRFVLTDDARFVLQPPITVSKEDADFFVDKAEFDTGVPDFKMPAGEQVPGPACQISRSDDKFVTLIRGKEGIVFDRNGLFKNGGCLETLGPLPAWLTKSEGKFHADFDYLDSLPVEKGVFIVFFHCNVHNYKHWWIDMLSHLHAASRRLKLAGYCLLPGAMGNLRPWQQDSLRWLDYGNLFSPNPDADVIRVEEAVWVDIMNPFPFQYDQLHELRQDTIVRLGDIPAPHKKIYIKRLNNLRSVVNEAEVDELLVARGFEPVTLETMTQQQQIVLFSQASVIIGNHGAGFSNILFSPPGTTVLEFMPSAEMRLAYWGIAMALEQKYGFIRCQSLNPHHFHDPIRVDLQNLAQLLERAS